MTMNNRDWDKAWFYLRNDDGRLPAYTGKILTERPESWGYRVSPPERQTKLKVYTDVQHRLAGKGEAEMWRAARGLGGETLGETEVALWPVRPRKSRTLVSGRGPEHAFGLFTPGEDLVI
jgi:hypothetical protein